MGKTFVSYQILRDGPVSLSPVNKVKDFTWNPSDDIRLDGLDNSPIINFRIDPSSNASGLALKVSINDQDGVFREIIRWTSQGGKSSAVSEVMDRNNVNKGDNKIRFEIDGGTGNLTVSDIFIMYKRVF